MYEMAIWPIQRTPSNLYSIMRRQTQKSKLVHYDTWRGCVHVFDFIMYALRVGPGNTAWDMWQVIASGAQAGVKDAAYWWAFPALPAYGNGRAQRVVRHSRRCTCQLARPEPWGRPCTRIWEACQGAMGCNQDHGAHGAWLENHPWHLFAP